MQIALRIAAVTAALSAVAVLSSCTEPAPEPQPSLAPSNAVVLQQNVPTPVEGGRLMAYSLAADSAWLSVVPTGSEAARQKVSVGDAVRLGESSYEVFSITAGEASEGPPGAGPGAVVVVPVGG